MSSESERFKIRLDLVNVGFCISFNKLHSSFHALRVSHLVQKSSKTPNIVKFSNFIHSQDNHFMVWNKYQGSIGRLWRPSEKEFWKFHDFIQLIIPEINFGFQLELFEIKNINELDHFSSEITIWDFQNLQYGIRKFDWQHSSII